MRYVVFDFETASECDLLKRGAWVYAADFSTRILCAGYKLVVDGKPERTRVLSERQCMALDPALMALVKDPAVIFVAHNCGFEAAIWKYQMEPMGWPAMPPERWHDTMAVAAMKALPLGLDKLTQALDLPVRKDMEGHRLMMRMCKPNLKGEWEHSDDNMKRLMQYNVGDCDAQYASYVATKGLGASERQVWLLDQKINQRGIRVDREFVHACQSVLEQVRVPMTARFRELTGGINPTQREKILNWVNAQGVAMGDMKKATLDAVLDPDDEFGIEEIAEPLPFHVHEVLQLRRSLASSSVAKLQRMLDCTGQDGRVRYTMQYHGARTGRWAGRLIQIQNYPRGEIQERQGLTPELLAEAIQTRDLSRIEDLWGPDIFSAVISSLRSCIVPAEGNVLVVGDYAAVEARNVLALAGQHDKVAMMHSGVDVYCEMGSSIFKKPVNKKDNPRERHIGKGAVLGCGYGLGPVGFRAKQAPGESIELAMAAVGAYRNDFAPMVPKFWYGLYAASVDAVWCSHAKTYDFAGIEFRREGDYLSMKIPSGRKIWYHKPEREKTVWQGEEKPAWSFMSYQGKKIRRHLAWHGGVTADCVQGTSRDLIAHALITCEREGLPVVFTAHDEIVAETKDRPGLALLLKDIMEDIPAWAHERKFLITAECDTMRRYRK